MSPSLPALSISDADLERMGDDELAALEDRLLLETELDLSLESQFTSGRAVVWVLTALGIVVALSLFSRLPTQRLGPLSIPLYLGAIGLGAAAAHLLWSAAGRRARETVRWVLGYWPLLLYLGAMVYRFAQRG
jgi:drug/metabolite transporter (DMT)-like permease